MHANFIVYSSVWPLRIGYDAFLKKIDDHAQHASIANPRTPQSYVLAYQLKGIYPVPQLWSLEIEGPIHKHAWFTQPRVITLSLVRKYPAFAYANGDLIGIRIEFFRDKGDATCVPGDGKRA